MAKATRMQRLKALQQDFFDNGHYTKTKTIEGIKISGRWADHAIRVYEASPLEVQEMFDSLPLDDGTKDSLLCRTLLLLKKGAFSYSVSVS